MFGDNDDVVMTKEMVLKMIELAAEWCTRGYKSYAAMVEGCDLFAECTEYGRF